MDIQRLARILVVLISLAGAGGARSADTAPSQPGLGSPLKKQLEWSDLGATPLRAARLDPRQLYTLYVPRDYDENGTKQYWLVVVVHGTERSATEYRSRYAQFAEAHDAIVLAPLFPINTHSAYDQENYKFIDYEGTRYDLVLLSMVDEVAAKYRLRDLRFLLFGFSGGGHFVHRFFYLHPHRLLALSIGAPGVVTLLDDTSDWWVGVRDVYTKFGVKLNLPAMRRVPVQMVVGSQDITRFPDVIDRASPYYMGEGVRGASFNAAGDTRIERIQTLKKSFEKAGIGVRYDEVEGAGHQSAPMDPAVQDFFARVLEKAAAEK